MISVITPTFNSEDGLEKSIFSVKNQKNIEVEHIIIDGFSNDKTIEIIKKNEKDYNLKWISEKDNGIADATNKGFKISSGNILCWLDSDNYYNESIFEEVDNIFKENQDIDIVYGKVDVLTPDTNKHQIYSPPKHLSFKNAIIHSTGAIPAQPGCFFRRELYEKFGGFDIKYKVAGDYDFWLRILYHNSKALYLDKVFGVYTIDRMAVSQSLKGIILGYKEVINISKKYGYRFQSVFIISWKCLKGIIKYFLKK